MEGLIFRDSNQSLDGGGVEETISDTKMNHIQETGRNRT